MLSNFRSTIISGWFAPLTSALALTACGASESRENAADAAPDAALDGSVPDVSSPDATAPDAEAPLPDAAPNGGRIPGPGFFPETETRPLDAECPFGVPLELTSAGRDVGPADALGFAGVDTYLGRSRVVLRFTADTAGAWRFEAQTTPGAPGTEMPYISPLADCALPDSPHLRGGSERLLSEAEVWLEAGEHVDLVVAAAVFGQYHLGVASVPWASPPPPLPLARGVFAVAAGSRRLAVALEGVAGPNPGADVLRFYARRAGGTYFDLGAEWASHQFHQSIPGLEPWWVPVGTIVAPWPFDDAPESVVAFAMDFGAADQPPHGRAVELTRYEAGPGAAVGERCEASGFFLPCAEGSCTGLRGDAFPVCERAPDACLRDASADAWTPAGENAWEVTATAMSTRSRFQASDRLGNAYQGPEVVAEFAAPEAGVYLFSVPSSTSNGALYARRICEDGSDIRSEVGEAPAQNWDLAVPLASGEHLLVVREQEYTVDSTVTIRAERVVPPTSDGGTAVYNPIDALFGASAPFSGSPGRRATVEAVFLDARGEAIPGIRAEASAGEGGASANSDDLQVAAATAVKLIWHGRQQSSDLATLPIEAPRELAPGEDCSSGGAGSPGAQCAAGTVCDGVCKACWVPLPSAVELHWDAVNLRISATLFGATVHGFAIVAKLFDENGSPWYPVPVNLYPDDTAADDGSHGHFTGQVIAPGRPHHARVLIPCGSPMPFGDDLPILDAE